MFLQGRAGIEDFARQARELGLILDDRTIRAFDLLGREMDTTRQRISVAGQAFLMNFLPAARLVLEWANSAVSWWNNLDGAVKRQVATWLVMTGAVLGVIAVLGTLAGALRAAIIVFRLVGLAALLGFVAPFLLKAVLIVGAVKLMIDNFDKLRNWWATSDFGELASGMIEDIRAAWAREDLTFPEKIVASVSIVAGTVVGLVESIADWWIGAAISLSRKTATLLGLEPESSAIAGLIAALGDMWEREDLAFSQKVIGALHLVPGGAIIADFISDLRAAWQRDDLSFPEKVVETVSVTIGAVAGVLESIASWWTGVAVVLAEKTVSLLGLDPEENALVGFLRILHGIWDAEELAFGEKVVSTLRLIPGADVVSQLAARLRNLWSDETLTLPEKVMSSVHITIRSVVGVIESIADWWIGSAITLARKTAVLMGLDPEGNALAGFLVALEGIWKTEDLSFSERTVAALRLLPQTQAVADFWERVNDLWGTQSVSLGTKIIETLELIPGPRSIVRFVADLQALWEAEDISLARKVVGSVSVAADIFVDLGRVIWDSDPVEFVREHWRSNVGTAIRLPIAGLIVLGWSMGAIPSVAATIGNSLVALGGLRAVIGSSLLAGARFASFAFTVAFVLDVVWEHLPEEFKQRTTRFFDELFDTSIPNILRASIGAGGAVTFGTIIGAAAWPITITAALTFTIILIDWDVQGARIVSLWEKLRDEIQSRVPWLFGTDQGDITVPVETLRIVFGSITPEITDSAANSLRQEMERALEDAQGEVFGPPGPPIPPAEFVPGVTPGLLDVIRQQEGSGLPHLQTGGPFQLRRPALLDLQQAGLGQGLAAQGNIVTGTLAALEKGGSDFARILAQRLTADPVAVSKAQELGISMAEAFSVAWVTGLTGFKRLGDLAEVITVVAGQAQTAAERVEQFRRDAQAIGIDPGALRIGMRGLQHGAILPGMGGPDSIPAILAPGEAITPHSIWSRGPAALLAWFRKMGAPGFQAGHVPSAAPAAGIGASADAEGRLAQLLASATDLIQTAHEREMIGEDMATRLLSIVEGIGTVAEVAEREFLRMVDALKGAEGNLEEALAAAKRFKDGLEDLAQAEEAKLTREQAVAQAQGMLIGQFPALANALQGAALAAAIMEGKSLQFGFSLSTITSAASNLKERLFDLPRTLGEMGTKLRAFVTEGAGKLKDFVTGVASGKRGVSMSMPPDAIGAIVALIMQSETFAQILAIVNPILQAAADALGMFLEPLLPLILVVSQALTPVLQTLGIIASSILTPAFQALFPVIKFLGQILLSFGMVVNRLQRTFIGIIHGLFSALTNIKILGFRPFAFLDGAVAGLSNTLASLDDNLVNMQDAQRNLAGLTWDQAMAAAKAGDETEKFAERLSSVNLPRGFRVATAGFGAMDIPSFHGGGIMPHDGPAMLRRGERVLRPGESGGGDTGDTGDIYVEVVVNGPMMGTSEAAVKSWVRSAVSEGRKANALRRHGVGVPT
ncbi:MAG: hypothetical protein Q8R92_17570 [Deltaproteobacteria bacterium]|nr:hypothetical protein [Deltaproteobacteria bacterium]